MNIYDLATLSIYETQQRRIECVCVGMAGANEEFAPQTLPLYFSFSHIFYFIFRVYCYLNLKFSAPKNCAPGWPHPTPHATLLEHGRVENTRYDE